MWQCFQFENRKTHLQNHIHIKDDTMPHVPLSKNIIVQAFMNVNVRDESHLKFALFFGS